MKKNIKINVFTIIDSVFLLRFLSKCYNNNYFWQKEWTPMCLAYIEKSVVDYCETFDWRVGISVYHIHLIYCFKLGIVIRIILDFKFYCHRNVHFLEASPSLWDQQELLWVLQYFL